MGLSNKQQEAVRELVKDWARFKTAQNDLAQDGADVVIEWVKRYNYGEPEIRIILHDVIEEVIRVSFAAGIEHGADKERRTNPALRAFGESVAAVRKAERAAVRQVVRSTFDALAESGTNAYFALNEALKAAE